MAENKITEIPIEEQETIETQTDQSSGTDPSPKKEDIIKETPAEKKRRERAEKAAAATPNKEEKHRKECERLAKEYSKFYPTEREFHVTTDYQVFLGGSMSAAQNHQRTRKVGGEVVTIKIK